MNYLVFFKYSYAADGLNRQKKLLVARQRMTFIIFFTIFCHNCERLFSSGLRPDCRAASFR